MNEQTLMIVKLIVSLVMLLILAICFLYGIIVGFKRSLISGLYNIVLIIILFFCTKSLANGALHFNLSFEINGETTIYGAIMSYLNQIPQIADIMASNPEAINTISQIPIMIASPFIFLIAFWIMKLVIFILSIIVNIIVSIIKAICSPKKKEQENIKTTKKSKHRLFGGLVGIGAGIAIIVATFIPIFGLNDMVNSLNKIKVDSNGNIVVTSPACVYAEGEQDYTPLLESIMGKEIVSIFDAVSNSVGYKVSSAVGIEKLCAIGFNNLTTTEIDGVTVKLKDNVDSALKTYTDYAKLMEYLNKESLTEEEMTLALAKAESLVGNAFKITIISAVADYLLPIIIDKVLEDDPESSIKLPSTISDDEAKLAMTKIVLNTLKTYPFEKYKDVADDLLDICKTLNENHILTPVYNSIKSGSELEAKDYISLIQGSNENFASDISNEIVNIAFVKDISKDMLKVGLEQIFKYIDSTYTNENLTQETATQKLSFVLSNVINTIKSFDTSKNYFVTKNSLALIGKIIDEIKEEDLMSTSEYADLVSYIQKKAKEVAFEINLNNVIDNLSLVTSFENELTTIGNSFEDIESICTSFNSQNFDFATFDFAKAGKVLNELNTNTVLFKDEVPSIYNQALDLISINNFDNVKNVLKISETSIDFEKELTAIKPMLTEVFKLKDSSITTTENIIDIIQVIKELDKIEQNTDAPVYGSKMETLLREVLVSIKTLSNNDETIIKISNEISAEIDTRGTKTLEKCVENGILRYALTLIPNKDTVSDDSLKTLITNINNNINLVISGDSTIDLKKEIGYIEKFQSVINNISNIDTLTESEVTSISSILEEIKDSSILSGAKDKCIECIFNETKASINPSDDKLGILSLLNGVLEKAKTVTLKDVYDDFTAFDAELPTLKNSSGNIETLDIDAVATSLNNIRKLSLFGTEFTNSIMTSLLTELDKNIPNTHPNRTNLDAIVNTDFSQMTIDDNTYKTVLENLKSAVTTI